MEEFWFILHYGGQFRGLDKEEYSGGDRKTLLIHRDATYAGLVNTIQGRIGARPNHGKLSIKFEYRVDPTRVMKVGLTDDVDLRFVMKLFERKKYDVVNLYVEQENTASYFGAYDYD